MNYDKFFIKAFNRYKDRENWKTYKIDYSDYLDSEDLTIPEKYEKVEGLWKYLDEEKGNKVFCFKKIEKLIGNEDNTSFKYSIDIKFNPEFNDIENDPRFSPHNFEKALNSVLTDNIYMKEFFKNNDLKIKVSHGETLFKKEDGKVYKTINIDYIFTLSQDEIHKMSRMKIMKQLISVIKKPLDATIDYVIDNF
ncbi:MAG: hypothetical protein KJ968_00575 [Nanoarchaeota archaeon]|nr:hypothetical protein [Nanoarchaeota archaeon]MBU4283581.1 hypothetical protein [Nanoarchaeota archaeon]